MAFIPAPKVAEVEIVGRLMGQVVENTLYFLINDEWSEELLLQLATDVSHWFVAHVITSLAQEFVLNFVQAKDLSTPSGVAQTYTGDGGTTGTDTSGALPGNVSLAVSFRTPQSGRSYRGRNFIAGLARDAATGNTINTGAATALVNAYRALQAAVTVPDAVWGVLSRYNAGAARAEGVLTPINAVVITDFALDSQRRRLLGRGE